MSRRTAMNPPTSAPVAAPQLASQLANTLTDALVSGEAALRSLAGVAPRDHRDRAASLLTIYDLHTAPLETVRAVARWQGHPAVADIKTRLEGQWLAELEASYAAADIPAAGLDTVDGAVAAIRAIAAKDRLPTAYRWLADEATWPEVVNFLALEGGPDGGFDDLIALCQVGLAGSAEPVLRRARRGRSPARARLGGQGDHADRGRLPAMGAADRARRLVALAVQPGLLRGGPDRPGRAPQRRLSRQNARVPTHVALLRGINVGGRNRVAMADLREVVTSLGHTEVTTYVQSGNVVFTSPDADTGALVAALEQRIGERRTPSACTHCSEAPSSVPTRPAPSRPRSSALRS